MQLFSIDTGTGLLRPTFDGWKMIPEGNRIWIDDFIPEGMSWYPVLHGPSGIRDGDEVLVVGARALGTGRAALPLRDPVKTRGCGAGA